MATTFHRTGQLRSDHDAGRFVEADSALLLSAGLSFVRRTRPRDAGKHRHRISAV